MTKTLGQEYRQMCEDMYTAPDIFFRDQVDMKRHNNEMLHSKDFCVYREGGIYGDNSDPGQPIHRTSISAASDYLRISVNCPPVHSLAQVEYGFDDQGRGFAKNLMIYSTQDDRMSSIPPTDSFATEQELTIEGGGQDIYQKIKAVLSPVGPELTHGTMTTTYTPREGTPVTLPVFSELPLRDVTIHLLHGWMQRTFPEYLRPGAIAKVIDRQHLKEKIAPIFEYWLVPTDETLDLIASREARNWELVSVRRADDMSALLHHNMLIRNQGAENVFHYQMSAMRGGRMIGVNLYFVKKEQENTTPSPK